MSEGKAFVIAVEEYQRRDVPRVDFAEADARAVAESLRFLGLSEDNLVVLLSTNATKTTIESKLRSFIRTVTEDDQLFFFYAGHGFASEGSNYITCHDSQPEDLPSTSISLQDLFRHLHSSHCRRIMLFLDSCHSGVQIFQGMRQLFVRRVDSELQELIEKDQYCVAFASCKADESSYSHQDLGHGI
ncbi:MAG: caspase family protein [Desulfomonile tiedjei]|nr:caspase family protein [Desulfomonile tiedjei]